MKITFVLPHAGLAGGVRVVAIYADRLRKRGHDVSVVSIPLGRPSWKTQVKSLLKGKGLVPPPRHEPSHLDYVDVPHHVIDRNRPITNADVPDADVVIATWWETAEWVARFSPSKGVKVYFLQHYEAFDEQPKERVMATWRLPFYKITISKWLVDIARKDYGDSDVALVHNSVDTDQFYAPVRGKQAQPTIGMMYSTAYWKGCSISLQAFELAAKQVPGLRMIAFGAYPVSSELPLPSNSEYILRPPQDAIRDIYAQCDVWLCGSWSEGFHLPPLEAMACRCPVVSTEVGGPMDIIKPGVNGYLVPCGDAVALAEKLIHVLSLSEHEWKALSDGAYATATGYTWDDATTLFETALANAIARHRAATKL